MDGTLAQLVQSLFEATVNLNRAEEEVSRLRTRIAELEKDKPDAEVSTRRVGSKVR